jgi:zinc-ribbon domain
MKNICSGCGTENLDSANFCHHCGKSMQDHAQAFQSSAWPELGIIASASAKAFDTVHQPVADLVVDESGPPDAPTHPEPQPPLDSLQVSAALQAVTKGVPERWSFVPIDENPTPEHQPAHQPKPSLDVPAEPPPHVARAKIEPPQDVAQTAHTASETEAVDSKFGWLETELHVWEEDRQAAGDVPFAKPKSGKRLALVGTGLIVAAVGAWWLSGWDGASKATDAHVVARAEPPTVSREANFADQQRASEPAPPAVPEQTQVLSTRSKNIGAAAVNKKASGKDKTQAPAVAAPVQAEPQPVPPPAPVASAVAPPIAVAPPTPAGPASPQEACPNQGFFARNSCMSQQCAKPAFAPHPQCQRWRAQQQEQEQQRLYGGS